MDLFLATTDIDPLIAVQILETADPEMINQFCGEDLILSRAWQRVRDQDKAARHLGCEDRLRDLISLHHLIRSLISH